MDSSTPSILPPRIRVPSTPSMLLSICFVSYRKDENKQKEAGIGTFFKNLVWLVIDQNGPLAYLASATRFGKIPLLMRLFNIFWPNFFSDITISLQINPDPFCLKLKLLPIWPRKRIFYKVSGHTVNLFSFPSYQCDQIWRNFTILAKF